MILNWHSELKSFAISLFKKIKHKLVCTVSVTLNDFFSLKSKILKHFVLIARIGSAANPVKF